MTGYGSIHAREISHVKCQITNKCLLHCVHLFFFIKCCRLHIELHVYIYLCVHVLYIHKMSVYNRSERL